MECLTLNEKQYLMLKPGTKDWMVQNIKTLQSAVKNGSHSTGFYPCSGSDGLRMLIAYDLEKLVTCDLYPISLEKNLEDMNIRCVKQDLTSNATSYKFTINGRPREILHVNGDVRQLKIEDFLKGKPDVYHVYLPLNAVSEQIDSDNYFMVNQGGFFCFGERSIDSCWGGSISMPKKLVEMLGLKEHEIVIRHPFNVSTSFYPQEEELGLICKKGFVYQKVAQKEKVVVDALLDIRKQLLNYACIALSSLSQASLTDFLLDLDSSEEVLFSKLNAVSGKDLIKNELEGELSDIRLNTAKLAGFYSEIEIKSLDSEIESIMKNELMSLVKSYKKAMPLINEIISSGKDYKEVLDREGEYIMIGDRKSYNPMITRIIGDKTGVLLKKAEEISKIEEL